jgi:beta-glucosidase
VRVHLAAGESRAVEFDLTPRDLSSVDPQGKRSVQPGEYSVMVGGAQPRDAEHVTGKFTITGLSELPE